MKFRHQVLFGLAVVVLVCGARPAPAEAQFTQQGPKLAGTDALGFQGFSVSLSDDGNTAILGAPGLGAARVYTRAQGVWSQQATLGSGGYSVALSSDGNTAIVGAPGVGAWVFTRAGGVWTQQATLRSGGSYSVALSSDGDTAILGRPDYSNYDGAAFVYTRSGGVWTEQATLVGTDAINAFRGSSVTLSSDASTALVGGYDDNNFVGAAFAYTRSAGVWTQQGAKLVGTGAVGTATTQGRSVSLSADGNTAIVGGPGDDGGIPLEKDGVGAAWVYARSGGVWTQQQPKLVGTGYIGLAGQGHAVALSGDGSTALVGGYEDTNGVGAAWVFTQPVFAGTPGKANCHGQSVSALARQYGGLNSAAAALGYADVSALQSAMMAYCGG